ncbi:MAG: helix-turn-helix domain-containing protein [Gammaproteobacteria bacterium]
MKPRSVAVVVFDHISPFHLSVPCIMFGEDRMAECKVKLELKVCSLEKGSLRTAAGFSIEAKYGLRALSQADVVIVPTWRDTEEIPPKALLDALRRAHKRGAIVVGLCLGSYVLAAAGLLDGLEATTHWHWATDLAAKYPTIKVNPEVLYVDQGQIITSAGTASAIDCCLHIIRREFGADIANYVARRMVVSPHRQGGQAQFIQQPVRSTENVDLFAAVLEWSRKNLHKSLPLDMLARRAAMTRRTFTRRFKQVMGITVGEWLLNQRLALAQQLLETTDLSVEAIAEQAGFGTATSLRQHFGTSYRISPMQYRKNFQMSNRG